MRFWVLMFASRVVSRFSLRSISSLLSSMLSPSCNYFDRPSWFSTKPTRRLEIMLWENLGLILSPLSLVLNTYRIQDTTTARNEMHEELEELKNTTSQYQTCAAGSGSSKITTRYCDKRSSASVRIERLTDSNGVK